MDVFSPVQHRAIRLVVNKGRDIPKRHNYLCGINTNLYGPATSTTKTFLANNYGEVAASDSVLNLVSTMYVVLPLSIIWCRIDCMCYYNPMTLTFRIGLFFFHASRRNEIHQGMRNGSNILMSTCKETLYAKQKKLNKKYSANININFFGRVKRKL